MNKFSTVLLFFHLCLLLILFDIDLSRNGFNETFNKYKRRYSVIKKNMLKSDVEELLRKKQDQISKIFYILDVVCAWYPRKAECIHKTLLGYRILRVKLGVPVEMVIGVKKFPLGAHAWLQIHNRCFFINEEESMKQYKIILSSLN
ncbi:hypothetical protein D3C87_902570 [compost metagenome]